MEVVESFGKYHLVKDSAGDHYAKEVSSGNLTKLFDSNGKTTVNQANFGGQTFYGVERINGKNYIAFYTQYNFFRLCAQLRRRFGHQSLLD